MTILQFDIWGISDVGQQRKDNEDAMFFAGDPAQPIRQSLVDTNGYLLAVADGVGSLRGGKDASHNLIEHFSKNYYKPMETSFTRHLNDAIHDANLTAHEMSQYRNASTTLVGAVIKDEQLHVFNVGDSRAYLIREHRIKQLTEDHTFGTRLIRYLVATPEADPDIFKPLELQLGDRIVICSDGLYKAIPDELDIMQIALRGSAEIATRNLVQTANDNGGRDNITVILARVQAAQPAFAAWKPRYESI